MLEGKGASPLSPPSLLYPMAMRMLGEMVGTELATIVPLARIPQGKQLASLPKNALPNNCRRAAEMDAAQIPTAKAGVPGRECLSCPGLAVARTLPLKASIMGNRGGVRGGEKGAVPRCSCPGCRKDKISFL